MLCAKDELKATLSEGGYVLFLGAGASMEAGLPSWEQALTRLADSLSSREPARANVIREDVQKGRLLQAADNFFLADITEAERGASLQAVFGTAPHITDRMKRLAASPYRCVVTTNYDLAFVRAAAQSAVDLVQFTESAQDVQEARVCRQKYAIRLHGRVEVPKTIVEPSRCAASPEARFERRVREVARVV